MIPDLFPQQWIMVAGTLVLGFIILFIATYIQQWTKRYFWGKEKGERRDSNIQNGTQAWINQLTDSHDRFTESLNNFTVIQQKNLDKLDQIIENSGCKVRNGLHEDIKEIKETVFKLGIKGDV